MSGPNKRNQKPYCSLSESGKWKRLKKNPGILEDGEDDVIETYSEHVKPNRRKSDDEFVDCNFVGSPLASNIQVFGEPGSSNSTSKQYSCNEPSRCKSDDEFDQNSCDTSPASSDAEIFGEPNSDYSTDYSNSDSESESNSCVKKNLPSDAVEIQNFLRSWAIRRNISNVAFSELCAGLKSNHPSCFSQLPSDARTILKTPVTHVINVAPGQYLHIGLEKHLTAIVSKLKSLDIGFNNELGLLFNIDGLPLFNSSPGEVYPILFSIPTVAELKNKVFPIGLYYGTKKAEDLNSYLGPFLDELLNVIRNGFIVNSVKYVVNVLGFCCDVPAKSYILGITSHTGYRSCTRCKVHGITVENRRVFSEADCPSRTHEEFINRSDLTFQPRTTPLISVPGLNFSSSFVLDYMHLICLGVMRTMLFIWCSGPLPLRLSAGQRIRLSEYLVSVRNDTPNEFVRKPREVTLLKSWKATEYRMFLLYFGTVILKEVLDEEKYFNFLSLHVATNILLDPKKCCNPELLNYAESLLTHFVSSVKTIYGEKYISHNFHNLTHIVDDARYFGPKIPNFDLNTISAFQFENFLQSVKRKVRGRSKPLQQIGRRLGEEFSFFADRLKPTQRQSEVPVLLSKHHDGPLPAFCKSPQFKKVNFGSFEITVQHPNNCCLLKNGTVVIVENVAYASDLKEQVLVGRKFIHMENLYCEPLCSSSDMGIFKVSQLSNRKRWPLSMVLAKCLLVNYERKCVAFQLLHSSLA